MNAPCLRDYMQAEGLTKPPPCFYCGALATTIDHARPIRGRHRAARPHEMSNLKPACRRCNNRKGSLAPDAFRKRLSKIAELAGLPRKILFHGEGARGDTLRRLRTVLDDWTIRSGRLVPYEATVEREKAKREAVRTSQDPAPRWLGRFTFQGAAALRAIAKSSGYSLPAVERFIVGAFVLPGTARNIGAACKRLGVDVDELRALKPSG